MFQAGHNTEVRQPWASDNTPTHKLWSQKVRWCKKCWPDKQREIEPPRWPWWWSYTNTQTCSLLNHCSYNHHWSCWENQISQTHMHTKKGPLRNSAKPEQQNPWRNPPSVNIDLKNFFLTICLIFSYKLDNVPATICFSLYKLFPCCLAAASKWDQPSPSVSCCVKGSKVCYTHYPSHFKESNLDSHTHMHMHACTHTHMHTHTCTHTHTHREANANWMQIMKDHPSLKPLLPGF